MPASVRKLTEKEKVMADTTKPSVSKKRHNKKGGIPNGLVAQSPESLSLHQRIKLASRNVFDRIHKEFGLTKQCKLRQDQIPY